MSDTPTSETQTTTDSQESPNVNPPVVNTPDEPEWRVFRGTDELVKLGDQARILNNKFKKPEWLPVSKGFDGKPASNFHLEFRTLRKAQ